MVIYKYFSDFYTTDQSKAGSKPSSPSYRTSTTKNGSTWSSTTKSGSTRSSLTLPSFKERIELFTPRTEGNILASPNFKVFTVSDLKVVTKNFCLENLIGEGGFSYVYKG
jgi:hypothetical protein